MSKRIAQCDTITGFVNCVVDMVEPVVSPPNNLWFVECDSFDKAGMYWSGMTFQKEPLNLGE